MHSDYSNDEIDDAMQKLADDIERRFGQPEFHGPAMQALLMELRQMEAARRDGDGHSAALFAASAKVALERYRPTNATSRSKGVLAELVDGLVVDASPLEP